MSKLESEAIGALVERWESRKDLQAVLSRGDGTVDVGALLNWAGTNKDPDIEVTSAWRPEIVALSNRLGLVQTNASVVDALLGRARNGLRRFSDSRVDSALTALALEIDDRPDLRQQFVVNGVIEMDAAVQWALTVQLNDASYDRMYVRRDGLLKYRTLRRATIAP